MRLMHIIGKVLIMSLYEDIKREIETTRIDKSSKKGKIAVKLYKPLLLLSMLDYHLDQGDETKAFNNPTDVKHLVDFFTIYLENELIKNKTYNSATNEMKPKVILKTIREHPLYHITTESKFFFNDLPRHMDKKPRKLDSMAKFFEIRVPEDADLERLCNDVRSACYDRIKKETGIHIQDSIITDLQKPKETNSIYTRCGQDQYRRKLLEKYKSKCAFCNFDVEHTLIASHAKPWRNCDSAHEKLSEYNGFLLCATHDRMFDQGYLTVNIYTKKFEISNLLKPHEIRSCKQSLPDKLGCDIPPKMRPYLNYHLDIIFKK